MKKERNQENDERTAAQIADDFNWRWHGISAPTFPSPLNYCPRRQCRGRVCHSRLVHWLGWVYR